MIVALLCPFLGYLNDKQGVRVNSAIALTGLAVCGATVSFFEIYSDLTKFWYLLTAHLMLSWWETTINYGVSYIFGLYSGSYAFAFIKTADVLASLVFLPAIFQLTCL